MANTHLAMLICSGRSSLVMFRVLPCPLNLYLTCLFSLSPHVGLYIFSTFHIHVLFLPFPPFIPESSALTSPQLLWLMLQAVYLPGFLTGLRPLAGGDHVFIPQSP